jgi:hypothetical protein
MQMIARPFASISALREIRGSFRPAFIIVSVVIVAGLMPMLVGCGGTNEGPTVVSEDVKQQQVRELNEQRASEWGTTKKK